MLERLLIAGSGGQGVLRMGKLLASVAVVDIPHVTFFPSYSAEVRGGDTSCEVILSSDEIASPVSDQFDSVILMNQASVDRFLARCRNGCLVLVNKSLCRIPADVPVAPVDATEAANRLGDTQAANLVMLGAYLARKPLVKSGMIEDEIRRVFNERSSELTEINVKAFRKGLTLIG